MSAAARVWGLNWRDHFPLRIGRAKDGIATVATADEVLGFFGRHAAQVFAAPNPAYMYLRSHPARLAYYRAEADCFGIYRGESLVGVAACNVVDWGTYYLRTAAILPEHRGEGYWRDLLVAWLAVLARHGVERVVGDVNNSNECGAQQVRFFNRLGFVTTGFTTSERWGGLVQMTKYLHGEAGAAYERLFASMFDQAGRD